MSDWSDFEDNLVDAFLYAAEKAAIDAGEPMTNTQRVKAEANIAILVDGDGSGSDHEGLRRAIRDYINYKIDNHTSNEDHD